MHFPEPQVPNDALLGWWPTLSASSVRTEIRGQTGHSPIQIGPIWEFRVLQSRSSFMTLSARSHVFVNVLRMARFARVVVVDVPHHVTQRGNARQVILGDDTDRNIYLRLLQQHSELHGLSLLGYCLMSNHVHLVAIPHTTDTLGQALKQAHGRYAAYWNARQSSSGHVWQGRFYSCPLDDSHLWQALRYVELNPVRARMVEAAQQWKWSSAGAHCGVTPAEAMLEMERWRRRWTPTEWTEFLAIAEPPLEMNRLRRSTYTGRPLGTPEFVAALERSTLRRLAPRKAGRRKSAVELRNTT